MAKPLDERIAAAMGHGARAATVADLITEVESTARLAQAKHDEFDAKSKSATSGEDEAEAAADEAAKLGRRILRLNAKRDQLKARHDELMNSERRKRSITEYEGIRDRRDQLAADLKERWPVILDEMMSLLTRIEASDAEIEASRPNVPSGYAWLEGAESLARGVPAHWYAPHGGPISRLTKIKIPAFNGDGIAWPDPRPLQQRMAAAIEAGQKQIAAERSRREAHEAAHARYFVTPPPDRAAQAAPIATYHGAVHCSRPGEIRMSADQVKAAEARGFKVTPLAAGDVVGLPMAGNFQ